MDLGLGGSIRAALDNLFNTLSESELQAINDQLLQSLQEGLYPPETLYMTETSLDMGDVNNNKSVLINPNPKPELQDLDVIQKLKDPSYQTLSASAETRPYNVPKHGVYNQESEASYNKVRPITPNMSTTYAALNNFGQVYAENQTNNAKAYQVSEVKVNSNNALLSLANQLGTSAPIYGNPKKEYESQVYLPTTTPERMEKVYCCCIVAVTIKKTVGYKMCGKGFQTINDLAVHQRQQAHPEIKDCPKKHFCNYAHKDVKNYPDDICGSGFKDKHSLDLHIDTHTGTYNLINSFIINRFGIRNDFYAGTFAESKLTKQFMRNILDCCKNIQNNLHWNWKVTFL